jgi:hypothetical protein
LTSARSFSARDTVPIEMSRCRARSRIPIKALRYLEPTGHSTRDGYAEPALS